jgi:hypothetical protein
MLKDKLLNCLDRTYERAHAGFCSDAFTEMVYELNGLRRNVSNADWHCLTEACRTHPVTALLHKSPMSRRAFEKPRGYAGDAELLDFIYGVRNIDSPSEPIVHNVYAWEFSTHAATSVRLRRDIIADRLVHLSILRPNSEVLAVACGHLRELQIAARKSRLSFSRFVAFDQDAISLKCVQEHAPWATPVQGSIIDIIRKRLPSGSFDFIYSAGLFDYLDQKLAGTLTCRLFELLNSGGTLLVANFAPDLPDIGYMEAIMDWRLLYRNESDVRAWVVGLEDRCSLIRTFRDQLGNIVYLEVTRK